MCIKILDWANRWLAPAFSALAALSGVLWEQDFAGYILREFPARTGLAALLKGSIPVIFMCCFLVAAILSSFRIFTQKTIGRLEKELDDEREKVNLIANNIETLVDGLLLKLSEKLEFAKGEPSRLTIYVHNNNGHFISFGRYTPDPLYRGKGRNLLPDNAGCISHAWSADWCYEGDLSYKSSRKKYNLEKKVYTAQRMKSACFAVKRIDASNSNKRPLAVLVAESKVPNRFPQDQIRSILENEEIYLAEIIDCLKDHIPDPQDATKRGF